MADSPSACSCSRIWPPEGRETWTTRTSAPRRLAMSPTGSIAFWAAQGLLTATRIRLMIGDCNAGGGVRSIAVALSTRRCELLSHFGVATGPGVVEGGLHEAVFGRWIDAVREEQLGQLGIVGVLCGD